MTDDTTDRDVQALIDLIEGAGWDVTSCHYSSLRVSIHADRVAEPTDIRNGVDHPKIKDAILSHIPAQDGSDAPDYSRRDDLIHDVSTDLDVQPVHVSHTIDQLKQQGLIYNPDDGEVAKV